MIPFLHNRFLITIILFILGILSSFSLPPYNFFFINFFTIPFFFYILVKYLNQNLLNNFLIGWVYGFGYFLSNLYWISNSLKFDENFDNLIIFSIIIIPFFLSIFYGLFSILLKFFNIKMNLSSILIFSLIISIFEYLRGTIFGGFPWNLISFSLIEFTSTLQLLNLIGTYSFNLLTITFYCLPVIIFFKISNVTKFSIIFSSTVFLFANSYYGDIRIKKIEQADKKQISPAIKLISPKFKIERFFIEEPIESKLIDLFDIGYPLNKDYLLVFPEGITNMSELNRFENDFSKISDKLTNNTKIILGITLDDGEKIYNSLALFNKKFILEDHYNKNKLVPFGEFLPFEKFLSNFGLKKITQGYRSFSSSNLRKVINVNSISFLPLICYEIIFSGKLNVNKSDYDFILNISEDGWFGDSIGPIQHFSHSIFRSIEEGKDILRVANNGITAHVTLTGKVNKKLNTTEKGSIEINSISKPFPTLFNIYGNKIFFFLVFFYITLIFFLKKKYEKKLFIHK
ncbi:apolipoprotein N-acyltransferase [Candidatus Pelagibacter sp.]|nr:apolipoprotein N-acyltransferase [Candidatus Pelagibacter sp.]